MFGIIKRILSAFWTVLDFTRRAIANVIFALIIIGVGAVLFYESSPTVADKSILVVNLSGNMVEQSELSGDTITALISGAEPETRLRDVLRAFRLAETDNRISGVLIRLDDLEGAGLASLREIGVAMDRFKASGKKITVWSTAFSQKQYAIASHASEVFMHPMGQVMIKGLANRRLYWGDALTNLGVTVHVFKAGEFKSAPESFILRGPSKESQEADRFWMNDAWSQFANSIETSRGLIPGAVNKMIAELPQALEKAQGNFSQVALNESLIDAIATEDEVRDSLLESQGNKGGERLQTIDYLTYLAANTDETALMGNIAVVTVEGEIKDGVDGPGMTGDRDTVERIRAARLDPAIKALVVRIDSPGGSAVASELIRRELELVKKAGKPVVASFGDYAASGGYWVALAADKIVADPLSITGSIGVFGMVPTFEKSLDKLDIGTGGVTTSWLADADNPAVALHPRYERVMELSVARTYRDFISLVAKSRNLSEKSVMAIAQGRVYTGRQALERGLADQLGSFEDAIVLAQNLAKLNEAHPVWFDPQESRFGMILERFLAKTLSETGLVKSLLPFSAVQQTKVLNDAERLMQLVKTPESIYAHCLCTPQ